MRTHMMNHDSSPDLPVRNVAGNTILYMFSNSANPSTIPWIPIWINSTITIEYVDDNPCGYAGQDLRAQHDIKCSTKEYESSVIV